MIQKRPQVCFKIVSRCFKHLQLDNHDVLQSHGQHDPGSPLCSQNVRHLRNISRLTVATFFGMSPSSGCSNRPRSPSAGHKPAQKSFWHQVEPRLATPLKDVEGVGIVSDVGHVARAMHGPSCSRKSTVSLSFLQIFVYITSLAYHKAAAVLSLAHTWSCTRSCCRCAPG